MRAAPRDKCMQLAQALIVSKGAPPATYPIALALLLLLPGSVDKTADWSTVIDFAAGVPKKFRDEPEIQEIREFAAAYAGSNLQAIAALDTLIKTEGPTPERLGLRGGR
jgi:hypothetical protein